MLIYDALRKESISTVSRLLTPGVNLICDRGKLLNTWWHCMCLPPLHSGACV